MFLLFHFRSRSFRMFKLRNLAAAVVLLTATGVASADTALIRQNGSPQTSVFPSQNGDQTLPYLLGVAGFNLTTLDVNLGLNPSVLFSDYATFNLATPVLFSIAGNPITSPVESVFSSPYSSFSISLYRGSLAAVGNPIQNATLLASLASPTSGGFYVGDLTAGNYLIAINGVGSDISTQFGYHVELFAAAVPEVETYAMMLAGLSLVGLQAARRNLRRKKANLLLE
jgi:hypothetical protein